ncbi:MAG: short chain dehydrogenase, partial [Actinomycetota bacterium]
MTAKRFSGMVAVITGAHQGIGRGVAERLGSEGAHVVCLDLKDCN